MTPSQYWLVVLADSFKYAPAVVSSGFSASVFPLDLDHNGFISDYELGELLKEAGHAQPGYMIREILQKLDRDRDNQINFSEFLSVSRAKDIFQF